MKSLVLLLALSGNVVASCEKGCSEWKGSCACDAATEKVEVVKASDEKPRRGQVPEWLDGTVHAFVSKPKPVVEIPDTADNHRGELIPADAFASHN